MRSFVLIVLGGSLVVSTCLVGQSLTEHAAAAAGATIGTAAGKPLGTALGNIFGSVDKSTSTAANPKARTAPKTAPVAPVEAPVPATIAIAPGAGGGGDIGGGSRGGGGAARHSSRRREAALATAPVEAAPIVPVAAPEPVVKEPTLAQVASIQVGATSSEVREALGAPESKVSIPGDDGHMLEICQYWAKGEQIGTVRLDNGHVVSVQTNN
jgi:hypothetical protein